MRARPRADRFPEGARVDLDALDVDAHAVLASLRRTEPVSWLGALQGWLVTGYDAAVQVMRDSATFTVDDPRFSTARVVGASMLSVDGDRHGRHRSPFAAPFRPARVRQRFEAEVVDLAADLLGRVVPDGSAELRRSLAGPLSVAVVTSVLGLEGVDADTVLGWYASIVAAVSGMHEDGPVPPEAAAAVSALSRRVRRTLRGDEEGSLLVEAGRSLPEEQVVSNAAVMMFGGIETTEGMILNAVVQLLRSPSDLRALREVPGHAVAVVEESLRLEPAAAVVDRYAVRDVTVAGADVRRGDLVRVSLAGANRDPAVFPDPDVFDPLRANLRSQLAFARGPHVCIAMDLARLEAQVAIRALAALPGLRLAVPTEARGLVFRKPEEVRVSWDRPAG